MSKSKSIPLTRVLISGDWGSVECVVRENGNCPAVDFVDILKERYVGKKEKNITAFTKFAPIFTEMANTGHVSKKKCFGSEPEELSAFKLEVNNVQIRFPCFLDRSKWIVTHGFDKPGAKKGKGKWPKREVDKAISLRDEYVARKAAQAKSK